MGEIAEGILIGDFDEITGEYIGKGKGIPRSIHYKMPRKSEDLSWKRVTGYLGTNGIKKHLHPQVLKDFGCTYSGKHPLRNACFEVLKDFERFKEFILKIKNT
jgi:hypothetical protein